MSRLSRLFETELFEACIKGDIDFIESFLSRPNNDYNDVFFNACKSGNTDIVEFAISKAIKDKKILSWNDGLEGACRGGHLKIAELMILKGANDWRFNFQHACKGGNVDIVKLMISKSRDITLNNYNVGLFYACMGGHMSVVEFIILKVEGLVNSGEFGEPRGPGGPNEPKRSLELDWNDGLAGASTGGHMDIVLLMISKGANDWDSGFCGARESGHVDLVHFMIEKGAKNAGACYQWPRDQDEVKQLLELGTCLEKFFSINGYKTLKSLVMSTQQSILRSNVMLSDLLSIVSKCIIII